MRTQAKFTGWTCVSGPESFVNYLVDHGDQVDYETFANAVNISSFLEAFEERVI